MQLTLQPSMMLSQQMKLAPRMIQAMQILQLPVMDLKERIERELGENPLLEEPLSEPEAVESENSPAESQAPLEQKELIVDSEHENKDDFERLAEMSPEDWPEDDYFYSPRVSSNRVHDAAEQANNAVANVADRPKTLQSHLLDQFRYFTCPPEIREFGEYLIQNLDGNGRVPSSLDEMARDFEKPIDADAAQQALSLIQKLDPPGVGARDLRECFLLQLRPTTPFHDVLVVLISSHLEDLAANRLPWIERQTGYDLETIKSAREELQRLNPRPGADFEAIAAPRIVPDVFVDEQADGRYVVRLEHEYLPRLRISHRYQHMLADRKGDPRTRDWIRRKIESARWLMEAIEQRYSTLKRVAQAIVDKQTAFLEKGPEHIAPLKMQQIADVVGVHVTTVSRAVDEKYAQTSRGIVPLKHFFGGGTTTTDGEEVAWDIIRIKLKEIIDREDKSNPLSDEALVTAVATHGYRLARRTVTKYRKALRIPSSRQRVVH